MNRRILSFVLAAGGVLAACAGVQGEGDLIARGDYLVNNVAGCNDCHSPRNAQGQLIAGRELTGAPLPFAPTVPMPWAATAPAIRGIPAGYTEEQFATLLQTGKRPNGSEPLPPMPPYRLTAEDARAVAAYIASLG
jgi:mono/diheme cytochrome c family protein